MGFERWRNPLVLWTFVAAGFAPMIPRVMDFPLLVHIPYLNFLLFLPGVLAGAWIYLRNPHSIRAWPMFVILGVMVVGLAWTLPSERGRGVVEIALVAVPLPLSVLISQRRYWFRAVVAYLSASTGATMLLFIDWMTSPARDELGAYRFGSLYDQNVRRIMEPNITATHLAFGVLLVAILWVAPVSMCGVRRARIAGLVCLPVLFAGMVMSGSRGGALSFLGALATLAALTSIRRRLPLRTNIAGGIGLVALAALLLLAPNPVSQRIDTGGDDSSQELETARNVGAKETNSSIASNTKSFGGRTEIWSAALEASGSSRTMLLFGAGTGGADHAVAMAAPEIEIARVGEHEILRANAHNSYLYWLVSFGIAGVLVTVAAFAVIALFAMRNDWVLNWAAGAAMLSFFLLTSVTLIAMRLEMTSVAISALTLGYILPPPTRMELRS